MENDEDEVDLQQPFKKRKGGQRQRLAVFKEKEASDIPKESSLATFLVSKWAWSFLSPQMVQNIAAKEKQDFKSDFPQHLEKLANLGGGLENKMSQDMLSYHKSWLPLGFPVKMPYKKRLPFQMMSLPHTMFACISTHFKDTFKNILCGADGDLNKFWMRCGQHPALVGHPAVTAGKTSKQIPLGIHEDGAPIAGIGKIWCRCCGVFSWPSLLSNASTKDKQFLIGMVWDQLQGPGTMDAFLKVLAWSIKYLHLGVLAFGGPQWTRAPNLTKKTHFERHTLRDTLRNILERDTLKVF